MVNKRKLTKMEEELINDMSELTKVFQEYSKTHERFRVAAESYINTLKRSLLIYFVCGLALGLAICNIIHLIF